MDYTIFIQPLISVLVATISGICSYLASRSKNKTDLKKQAKEHEHTISTLQLEFKHQIENLQQQHRFELEKVQQAHELRLSELEKVSQLDAKTDKEIKLNDFTLKVLTGEADLDHALAISGKIDAFNQKQALQQQFVRKTTKKNHK